MPHFLNVMPEILLNGCINFSVSANGHRRYGISHGQLHPKLKGLRLLKRNEPTEGGSCVLGRGEKNLGGGEHILK